MLVLSVVVYGKGFISAGGSYAFGTQILFFSVATAATYSFSFGLPQAQKSVLALGMSTRNLGAAFAPLFAIQDIDQRAIVMVAIGVPMQTIASLLAARWFARGAPIGEPGAAQTAPRGESA
jgi:BASS family bile acid:Na+ symporter